MWHSLGPPLFQQPHCPRLLFGPISPFSVARIKASVTPWIHPEAVFMLHGYGATVPLATRARGLGVADQGLQQGKLYAFDPAGGGCAMTEAVVHVRPAVAEGGAA